MKVFVIKAATLTFAPAPDGSPVTLPRVDVNEHIDCYVRAFDTPCMNQERNWKPGSRMLVVIDGRMYRDVVGLTLHHEDGSSMDALANGP